MQDRQPGKQHIAASSSFLYRRSLETNLRLTKEAGFEYIELFISRNVVSMTFEEIWSAVEESGLNVASIHLPIPFSYNSFWPNLERSMARGLEWAEILGVDWVVSHPLIVSADADSELHQAMLDRYFRILRSAAGIPGAHRLLIENMPKLGEGRPIRNLFRYPDGFLEMLHEFGFGMAFDTTHWGSFALDVSAGYRHFEPFVRNIHVSDFADGVEHIVPGEGDIDLDKFLNDLKSAGYSGQLTIELDFTTRGRNEGRDEDGIVRDLSRCREWLEGVF
jgi:sugar phosphate isomerase/epimerase